MPLVSIFRKSPFARLLIFYASGILAAQPFHSLSRGFLLILAGISAILLTILVCTLNRHQSYFTLWINGLLSGLVLFLAGFINMGIRHQTIKAMLDQPDKQGVYLLHISGIPEIRENYVRSTAMVISGNQRTGALSGKIKILVYFENDSLSRILEAGNWLVANARIMPVAPPGNPDEFNYRQYLSSRKIYRQTYLRTGSWKLVNGGNQANAMAIANKMLGKLLNAYQQIGLNNNLYGILAAMTLGYRDDLEGYTKQIFSQAGVMHVMALSGFNVAVIALTVGFAFSVFKGSPLAGTLKTIVIVLVVWLFAFITGLSASVTRAAAMISLVLIGRLVNRQINTINMLFATAFILLACSPGLLTDVSFQLSFTAVWGIVLYQPVIYRFITCKYKVTDSIWKLFTVSCAAQLATLPLMLYYFHQFPVYFWLTNLYVVPLVSLIIIVAGVYLLVFSFYPLAIIVGKFLALLLEGLYQSVKLPEILPFAVIEGISINRAQALLLFIMVFLLALFFMMKRHYLLALSLLMLVVVQTIVTFHRVQINNQRIMLVGNLKGHTLLNLIAGRSGVLYGDSSLTMADNRMNYALANFWIRHGVSGRLLTPTDLKRTGTANQLPGLVCFRSPWLGNNTLLSFERRRILLLQDNKFFNFNSDKRLKVNVVIVSGEVIPDQDGIARLLEPGLLIIDSSVNRRHIIQWQHICKQLRIPCWNIAEKGAYLVSCRQTSNSVKDQPAQFPGGQ